MYHVIYRERAIGIQDLMYIERVREYRASERNLRSDIYRESKRVQASELIYHGISACKIQNCYSVHFREYEKQS